MTEDVRNPMTATETTTPTFAAGDRFTYTGDPRNDALSHTIRTGVMGTLDRSYGDGRWLVEFDRGENYIGTESNRSGNMWVTESNITKLVEPAAEGFKVGDRFTYTANPRRDYLNGTILTGATGTLDRRNGGVGSWIVTFDEGENYIGNGRNRSGCLWVTEPNITKLAEPAAEGFKAGDRFTYTGNPYDDALSNTIRTGVTGTLDRSNGGTYWIATFDSGENYIGSDDLQSGRMWVSEANIAKLVEPEGFKAGDRFTYTADPCLDFLRGTIRTGVTGTLARQYDTDTWGARWIATFDEGENYIGEEEDRIASVWVTESNIVKLVEPAAIDALHVALAERDKAVAELAEFKAQVVSVAREYAKDNGWCSTVDEALSDLGLETESTTRVRATIILELDVKHSAVRPIDEDVEAAVEALAIPGFDSVDGWDA